MKPRERLLTGKDEPETIHHVFSRKKNVFIGNSQWNYSATIGLRAKNEKEYNNEEGNQKCPPSFRNIMKDSAKFSGKFNWYPTK